MLTQERGDTLIEVIVATAVLAMIIVLSIGIMNRGTAQAQRAVEGTFVRQEIDSQTELLRYARDSYVDKSSDTATKLWNDIRAKRSGNVMSFTDLASLGECKPPSGQNAFYLVTNGGEVALGANAFTAPQTYATAGNGVWIEATSASANANYLDFYIYACWSAITSGPNSTTGTIVRVYAPAQ